MLSPIIILVEPQLGENIGSACRAMLNFNVKNLRLVNPRDGWPNPDANAMSAGALNDKNFKVSVFKNLNEASKDISYLLATTARPRDINKPIYNTKEAILNIITTLTQDGIGEITGIIEQLGGFISIIRNDVIKPK